MSKENTTADWKGRLTKEAIELKSRIYLLQMFIAGDKFKDMSFKLRMYMLIQYRAMKRYLKYLKKRMEALEVSTCALEDDMSESIARAYLNETTEVKKAKKSRNSKPEKKTKDVEVKKD